MVSAWCCALAVGMAGAAPCAAQTTADLQAAQWASSCVTCHGAARPVRGSTIPMLAGRPAAQIEKQMREFAAGARPGLLMRQIARGYDERVVRGIARWYAQLVPDKP